MPSSGGVDSGTLEITVLGSSDAFCSGAHLNAAYLFRTARSTFLVDCGPTTLLGLKQRTIDTGCLDFAVVSHMHGDHFAGLPFLLLEYMYENVRERPFLIVGPEGIEERVWTLFRTLYSDVHSKKLPFELRFEELVPEQPTGVDVVVADTRGRCDRMRRRWPATAAFVEPLMAIVEEAATCLDPTAPALVHGDLATGQFLWTGARLVLLDLDMFGYTDPAYDAGHFLAQLERRCLREGVEPTVAGQWLAAFRDAYLEAMPPPRVSPRNMWFYHGITLVRKIYTLHRKQPPGWQRLVVHLIAQARTALQEAMPAAMERR